MQIFNQKLTSSYDDNILMMDRLLRVDKSFDLIRRPMRVGNTRMVM